MTERICCVCGNVITDEDMTIISTECDELFAQAHAMGIDSCTGFQQVLLKYQIHLSCYDTYLAKR